MKKSLFLLASLSLGTAAIAQDMPAPQTPPATMPTTPDATPPAPPPTATPPADASAVPAPATTSTPDAAAMPAPTAAADDSNLPFCSRTVTDKCKQHEGGAHKPAHKKHK